MDSNSTHSQRLAKGGVYTTWCEVKYASRRYSAEENNAEVTHARPYFKWNFAAIACDLRHYSSLQGIKNETRKLNKTKTNSGDINMIVLTFLRIIKVR